MTKIRYGYRCAWILGMWVALMSACSVGGGAPPPIDAGGGADAGATGPPGSDAGRCLLRCGTAGACCAEAEECVSLETDRCLPECDGNRCGELCCASGELCVGSACVAPGPSCSDEGDCAPGFTCEPLVGACVPIPDGADCRFTPPSSTYEPELQWEWTDMNVAPMPLVVRVDDDDGDGRIGLGDTPDVIVVGSESVGFRQWNEQLIVLSGDDGHEIWRSNTDVQVCAGTTPAAGDIDGDGFVEIVTAVSSDAERCGETTVRLAAFDHLGQLQWVSNTEVASAQSAVAIADLDGDGSPEVIGGGSVFASDGTHLFTRTVLSNMHGTVRDNVTVVMDVDGDGDQELLENSRALDSTGEELWSGSGIFRSFSALGHLLPEHPGVQIVSIDINRFEIRDASTGATLFGPAQYRTGGGYWAGPPTIADFDGDGRAEIGVAGETAYYVLDPQLPAPHVLWEVPSEDVSTGSVGSTVFDFDADGSAEVVFADECHLQIRNGRDGSLLWSTPNTHVTMQEYPVVADVDGDGNAEIVVVSNRQTRADHCLGRTLPFPADAAEGMRGVRVYRDRLDHWVPTRSIWNQHAYFIDNVGELGDIPSVPATSWTSHNSFRLNALPAEAVTLSPDLRVLSTGATTLGCPNRIEIRARVQNAGARGVGAGMPVTFYEGEGALVLGTATTVRPLLSGESAWVTIAVEAPALDSMGRISFFAVADDDGSGRGLHSECHEDNNRSPVLEVDCRGPI